MESVKTRKELEAEIVKLELEAYNFELDNERYEEQYREALNSAGDITVCGLTFCPAYVLEQLDPIAYRCGLNDYVDGLDKEDDPDYQEIEKELEERRNELGGN